MPLFVKGEGGANLVLAWREEEEEDDDEARRRRDSADASSDSSGSKRRRRRQGAGGEEDRARDDLVRRALEGNVLRVRKLPGRSASASASAPGPRPGADAAAAAAEAALDAAIWAPLVGGAGASRAERDEAFAHRVLAPALGCLLQRGRRLPSAAGGSGGGDGDGGGGGGHHHQLSAALSSAVANALGETGASPVLDPLVAPEILPDATAPLTAEELAEAADALGAGAAAAPCVVVAVGPAACFEFKPKCGGAGRRRAIAMVGEATSAAAIEERRVQHQDGAATAGDAAAAAAAAVRRRFPRFAMHALLKQQQQGQQQQGQQPAQSPSSVCLYDPWRLFDAACSGGSRASAVAAAAREVGALLERPSNNLRAFSRGRLVFGRRPGPGGGGGSGDGDGCALGVALSGAFLAPGRELAEAAERAKGGGGGGGGVERQARGGGNSPPPPPAALTAALLAGALLSSGALAALLSIQAGDELGAEGAARLHASLLERIERAAAGTGGAAAQAAAGEAATAAAQQAASRLPARDLALMRGYGAAVTARDASVMVTLQQVALDAGAVSAVAAAAAAAAAAADPPAAGDRAAASAAPRLWPWPWPLAGGGAALDLDDASPPSPRCLGLLLDPRERARLVKENKDDAREGGCGSDGDNAGDDEGEGARRRRRQARWVSAFAWRARVVDTDLKPASKARAHADLERRCVEHALGGGEGEEEEEGGQGARGQGGPAAPPPPPAGAGLPPRLRRYAAEREAWCLRWEAEWRAWESRDVLAAPPS